MPKDVTAIEIVWRNPWVRAITYVFGTIFLVYLLWRLRGGYVFALQVAIIGFVIAYILNPIVAFMSRIHIRRAFAVVLVYVSLLMALILGSALLSQVVTQIGQFVRLVPTAIDNIIPFISGVTAWFDGFVNTLPDFVLDIVRLERPALPLETDEVASPIEAARQIVQDFLAQAALGIQGNLRALLTGGGTVLLTGVTTLISTTLQVFLILLASAYFLYDYPKFTASFRRYVPSRWRPLYADIIDKTDMAVGGYLRGQLAITSCLGVFIYIGLRIVGVPLPEAISVLAAVFNLVPYLGPIIGVLPAVLLGFTVSPLTALLAVVVFIVANQIEGNILGPFILSKSTNLHPITVLLSILVGVGMLGFVGALLAVPVVALTKVILEEYLLNRPAYQTLEVVEVPPPPSPTPEAAGRVEVSS